MHRKAVLNKLKICAVLSLTLVALVSCSGEKKTIPSTDSTELAKYINLEKYMPLNCEWTYSKMGVKYENRTPGPNDYKLNALLHYPLETIETIKKDYSFLSVNLESNQFSNFKFDWLNDSLKVKIGNGDFINYNAAFFKKGSLRNGTFIILNDSTLLLNLYTI